MDIGNLALDSCPVLIEVREIKARVTVQSLINTLSSYVAFPFASVHLLFRSQPVVLEMSNQAVIPTSLRCRKKKSENISEYRSHRNEPQRQLPFNYDSYRFYSN
jgi:hypothetical protein